MAAITTAHSMVCATPKRWASQVVTGAAAMEATPAMAELRPIIVEEMPRFSRMMLSSGRPRPMAMPTAEIAATAALTEGQWILSSCTAPGFGSDINELPKDGCA